MSASTTENRINRIIYDHKIQTEITHVFSKGTASQASAASEQQVLEQHKWDSLTPEEQGFLEAGVWGSLDEAYAYAIANRPVIAPEASVMDHVETGSFEQFDEKIAHLSPLLSQFKISEDEWMASEENVRYFMNSTNHNTQKNAQ